MFKFSIMIRRIYLLKSQITGYAKAKLGSYSRKLYFDNFSTCLGLGLSYGTIIPTGITCKKIPCYCLTQLAGGLLLKKLKYFEVMLNIFDLSRVWEKIESCLVYANKLFWIAQPDFSTDIIKRTKGQLLFLAFQTFNEKIKFRYNLSIL